MGRGILPIPKDRAGAWTGIKPFLSSAIADDERRVR